jgi:ubiquinone/menaquinone biosynthesis C-methylase UbiE
MNQKDHWDRIYSRRQLEEVGWYRPHLERSLELIQQTGIPASAKLLDVGGGASSLVDDLLAEGFHDISVVDISTVALNLAKNRLGEQASTVHWIEGDITQVVIQPSSCDLWHDRAVFHFLLSPAQRQAYLENARRALKPRGYLIVAAFAPSAPPRCSGLEVIRYSADALSSELGEDFQLVRSIEEIHFTPGGVRQDFVYCLFQKSTH